MELIIALFTFFGVALNTTGSRTEITLSSEKANYIKGSSEYDAYLKGGGVDVFDFAGTPAIDLQIRDDWKE